MLAELYAELKENNDRQSDLEKSNPRITPAITMKKSFTIVKNDSENDSICLSNIESDINSSRLKKGSSANFRFYFGQGGITTGDEGGHITVHDESATTDPEIDFKSILNTLNKG
jgi:hypothetical protein